MTLQEAATEAGVSVEEFENEKDESLFYIPYIMNF